MRGLSGPNSMLEKRTALVVKGCPTPVVHSKGSHLASAGVRQPLTEADLKSYSWIKKPSKNINMSCTTPCLSNKGSRETIPKITNKGMGAVARAIVRMKCFQ